jgi:prolyl oligopeptidase PreP (S9A serine peptidase family)
VIVPEGKAAIEAFGFTISGQFPAFMATKTRLYVVETVGGPQEIRIFDHAGKDLGKVRLAPISAVSRIVPLEGDEILVNTQTYLKAGGYYRYAPASNKLEATALRLQNAPDLTGVEATLLMATSRDGTRFVYGASQEGH